MEHSCGILAYRIKDGRTQVLLGRNGGPFKCSTPYNIPKGHVEEGEDDIQCATREFAEETGLAVPDGKEITSLGTSRTSKGKVVTIFAVEHDYNPDGDDVEIDSIMFEMEYPRGSGKIIMAPELESAKYLDAEVALERMFPYQRVFVERLVEMLRRK